ncbi:MAG TPA: NAD-dependent succinate-semialdehyde dehydrogenase [Tepidisphaeraceae bacterium]|jgi:succinate-semialdehyde dehydrogenase/glutarate-semialdehyde dehydrogenase|nr:NAD-dependent succinate-semialdehyde dehydrogenase [Tepidisphaeraceae bacterium]
MRSIDPTTELPLEDFVEHSPDQVKQLLDQAGAAFRTWREVPLDERSRLMRGAGRVLRERSAELARLMSSEMGKPVVAAEAEIEKCAACCDHFADHGPAYLSPQVIPSDATRSYVQFDPLGAVLAIMPWNFPFWQVFRFAAPALVAGNVGVLKHAPNVPGCAVAIEDVFRGAGFPAGVFTTLLVDTPAVAGIIRDATIAAVTLTGSDRAGAAVAAQAGAALKKCVLELGGSDPFIVLPDADVEATAKAAAAARTINSGQSCIAAKRFIVVGDGSSFEKHFARALEALKVGDPADRSTDMGPLARLDLLENLERQVRAAVAAGARIVTGGRRLPRKGYFYIPTLLADVKPGNAAFDEEVFGPVAAFVRATDMDDAVRLANASPYGLGASIWTADAMAGEALAARIESGSVFVNGPVKSDPRLPFGGIKRSGYGRELAAFGIHEFVNVKTVWVKEPVAGAKPETRGLKSE